MQYENENTFELIFLEKDKPTETQRHKPEENLLS